MMNARVVQHCSTRASHATVGALLRVASTSLLVGIKQAGEEDEPCVVTLSLFPAMGRRTIKSYGRMTSVPASFDVELIRSQLQTMADGKNQKPAIEYETYQTSSDSQTKEVHVFRFKKLLTPKKAESLIKRMCSKLAAASAEDLEWKESALTYEVKSVNTPPKTVNEALKMIRKKLHGIEELERVIHRGGPHLSGHFKRKLGPLTSVKTRNDLLKCVVKPKREPFVLKRISDEVFQQALGKIEDFDDLSQSLVDDELGRHSFSAYSMYSDRKLSTATSDKAPKVHVTSTSRRTAGSSCWDSIKCFGSAIARCLGDANLAQANMAQAGVAFRQPTQISRVVTRAPRAGGWSKSIDVSTGKTDRYDKKLFMKKKLADLTKLDTVEE